MRGDRDERLTILSEAEKVALYPDKQPGLTTIEVCGLNSVLLFKPRADILINLRVLAEELEHAICEYKNAGTDRIKGNRVKNLREAIERIEMPASPKEQYSNFCGYFLKNCMPYIEAKSQEPKPSRRIAFCLRMSGATSGLKPAFSKSASQRSGVIKGKSDPNRIRSRNKVLVY